MPRSMSTEIDTAAVRTDTRCRFREQNWRGGTPSPPRPARGRDRASARPTHEEAERRCCSGSSRPVSSASASTRWPTLVTARSEVELRDASVGSDQLLPSADAPTQTSNSCVRDLARRRPCNHSAHLDPRDSCAMVGPQYLCGKWTRGVSEGCGSAGRSLSNPNVHR